MRKEAYFTRILENCDGSMEFLVEVSEDLLQMFSEETLSALGGMALRDEGERLADTAHKLRGAVVNFNMTDAAQQLRSLENMGRAHAYEGAEEALAALRAEMLFFKDALESVKEEMAARQDIGVM